MVPCYNEANRLQGEEFRTYVQAKRDVSFLFVNDGSTDQTLQMLQQLGSLVPAQIQILNMPVNSGKAEAVREGMLAALSSGPAYVGFWDADLATPLAAIDDLLGVFAGHPELEIVLGARVKLLGRDVQRLAVRHYLGRAFATCVSAVLRLPIYDTQCGAKLFRVSEDLETVLQERFSSRWIFDVELLARFLRVWNGDREQAGRKIYEFPLHRWRDIPGSKVRAKDFVTAAKELLGIWWKYRRQDTYATVREGNETTHAGPSPRL